ncbi:MAG TPA: HlyD family efflux transporter periplasmic adaptor subunit, partial [Rhodocyclaceae bacterium]|nr:HlyD family efflux transporter periplasmic adaptor subunit [Rhodocyclaceae bacterium]
MTPNSDSKHKTDWRLLALVLITLAVLALVLWRIDRSPRTDDAYVYADTINVVPEVSGRIIDLPVHDNQAVRQGDVLFRIDPRPYQDALERAKARLAALDKQIMLTGRTVKAQEYNAASVRSAVERARAAAQKAEDTLRRVEPLLGQGYASAEEVDQARTAQRATKAELDATLSQAQQAAAAVSGTDALVAERTVLLAEIAIAELNLEFTVVRAPFDGRVVSLKTSVGQFVSAQKAFFTLIDTRQWYVVANFRETELKDIVSGTPATLYLMNDPSRSFAGTVDAIGYGVLPNDGGTVV